MGPGCTEVTQIPRALYLMKYTVIVLDYSPYVNTLGWRPTSSVFYYQLSKHLLTSSDLCQNLKKN